MGTPIQYYVDPSIAGDSGTGTIGDPYGDLQYALNRQGIDYTRNATHGDQFNVKAGTDEILAAALTLATYGTPGFDSQLIIRGYTNIANDGGIGGISGNGSVSVISNTSYTYVVFIDMHLHNCGAADIVTVGPGSGLHNCELDNTTGDGYDPGSSDFISVSNCHFHNIGGVGLHLDQYSMVYHCYFEDGANTFTDTLIIGQDSQAWHNIIDLTGNGDGIRFDSYRGLAAFNIVYCSGGTGDGIQHTSGENNGSVFNNYIEGFSGVGGAGINITRDMRLYGHNYAYNNTDDFNVTGGIDLNLGNNTSLSASALTDPANDDFTISTALAALGWPTSFKGAATNQFLDIGAAQRKSFPLIHPGYGGGLK